MNKADTLGKTSKDLMMKEPYYGLFLIMLNKVWSERLPTAGVSKNGINYQLAINPEFWENLSDEHRMGLLKHELLHIAFGHLSIFFKFSDRKLANIAMDMEINQYIQSEWLPEGGIDINNYPELNLDRKAGCRYYYDKLKQAKDEKDKNGTSGSTEFDKLCDKLDGNGEGSPGEGNGLPDHSTWEEFEDLTEAEQKLIDKQVQRIMNNAKNQTLKTRGNIPGELNDKIILEEIIAPKFNWRAYIRRFTGVSTKIFTKKTRRKENIRFSDNPGIKIKMRQKMLLAIDTSGSVSNDELTEFMNEIYHIYNAGVDITVVQCDTAITSIAEYKGTFELGVIGRGGTEFDPVLKYYMENRQFTSLIYFTDGECNTSLKPSKQILWVISERSQLNTSLPGKVIKLEL
jgi:predicted metal-dependent peptidase